MSRVMRILEWKPVRKGSLLGFAKVELPSGMILVDVTILTGDRGPWAAAPGKPSVRDGSVVTDGNGRPRYVPVVEFVNKQTRDQFSAGVIQAMQAAHPEVVAQEAPT